MIPAAARVLGFGGLIPFAVAGLSQWVELPILSSDAGLHMGTVYGAVILSFLGGIRWGAAITAKDNSNDARDLSGSVVAPLAGWLSLLLAPVAGLCLLIAGFLLQALWDLVSAEKSQLPQWFGKLRMLLTAGAVICLCAMLVRQTIS